MAMDKRYKEILDKLDRILALLEGNAGMADTPNLPKHDGVNVSEKPAEAPHGFGGRRENPKPVPNPDPKPKDK